MDEACLGINWGTQRIVVHYIYYVYIYIYTYLKGISVFLDAFRP